MKSLKKLLVLPLSTLLVFCMVACDKNTPSASSSNSVTPSVDSSSTGSSASSVSSDSSLTESSSSSVTPEPTLYANEIRDYISQTYGKQNEANKTAEFTLPTKPSTYAEDGTLVTATVDWTVTYVDGVKDAITPGTIGENTLQSFNVKYDAENSVESHYTLTGAITVTETDKATVELNFVVPEFKYADFATFKELADAKSTEIVNVKGKITAKYQGNPYIVNDANEGFYAYAPTNYTADNFNIGDEVLVAGTTTLFSGQYEFAKGCTVTLLNKAETGFAINYDDVTEAFANASSSSDDSLVNYQNRPIEVKGAKLGRIDNANLNNNYHYFTIGDREVEFYFRPSTSYNNFTSSQINEFTKNWTAGYTATLRGLCSTFGGKYYISPIELDNGMEITERTVTDEQNALNAATEASAKIKTKYVVANKFELLTTSSIEGATLSYSITGAGATITDGKLVVTPTENTTTATVTVSATYNGKVETVDVEITVVGTNRTVMTAEEAYTQIEGMEVSSTVVSEESYFVKGIVQEIYNNDYCNFYLTAGDKKVTVYGLSDAKDAGTTIFGAKRSGKMPEFEVGDEVLLYANFQHYNATTMELVNAWLVSWTAGVPADLVEKASYTPLNVNEGDDGFSVFTSDSGFYATRNITDNTWTWSHGVAYPAWTWLTITAVDNRGRVAYSVWCAGNGYGKPSDTDLYYHNSYYNDWTTNPALTQTDTSWTITAPEGGFVMVAYVRTSKPATGRTYFDGLAPLTDLVSGGRWVGNADEAANKGSIDDDNGANWNKPHADWDTVRVFYNADTNKVTSYDVKGADDDDPVVKIPENYEQKFSYEPLTTNGEDTGFSVYTEDSGFFAKHNPTAGTFEWSHGTNYANWQYLTMTLVDAEGRVAYSVWCTGNGYGNPADNTLYYANSHYSDYTTNPAVTVTAEGWELKIPEGGFAMVAYVRTAKPATGRTYYDGLKPVTDLVSGGRWVGNPDVDANKGSIDDDNGANWNKPHTDWDTVRVFFDADTNTVTSYDVKDETVTPGPTETVEVTLDFTTATVANATILNGTNQASLVGLDDTVWSLVGIKNANNFPACYNEMRLYKNGCALSIANLEGMVIKSISFVWSDNNSKSYASITAGDSSDAIVANEDGSYTINATSLKITNVNASNQCKFKSMTIVYVKA